MSLHPRVVSPIKAPKALYNGLRAVLNFLSGEKRTGIPSVFEFRKRGGDRSWRSFVCLQTKSDLQHSLNHKVGFGSQADP